MTPIKTFSHKNTSLKLSEQVKQLLHEKGFSFLFNFEDYQYFKMQSKNAFNKAQHITRLFIQENNAKSDYNEYIF